MVEINEDQVKRLSHTQSFKVPGLLVTRRDTTFPITLQSTPGLKVQSVSLSHKGGKQVTLKVVKTSTRGKATIIEVHIPVEASVTQYTLNIKGNLSTGKSYSGTFKKPILVLFNPWSTNDSTYMKDDRERNEYVTNQGGRLYIGNLRGTSWNLALYRPDCLRATLYLLEDLSKLTFEQKSDPIMVAREMSALVNSPDEEGVLVGRWDGNYRDGRTPGSWRGSGEILRLYYKSRTPVKYGQCWVFSGVLLTVLRILGIPSRSVTNFDSAHDTNRNRTIEMYYDQNYTLIRERSESVWNFHVWNEAWMTRPDLPSGFEGWQAVDATPQEPSQLGRRGYRMGPASLKAIKAGNSVKYDTIFVIAEVDADIKTYKVVNEVPKLISVEKTHVGKNISTKAVGSSQRADITSTYKKPESPNVHLASAQDVSFEIPKQEYKFGQDIKFEVNITSPAGQHQIKGKILCDAVNYTGKVLRTVNSQDVDVMAKEGKMETVSMSVEGGIFSEYPGTKVYLRFDVVLAVEGTSQIFIEKVPVAPTTPELKIVGPDKLTLGKDAQMTAVFQNPLSIKMSDVTLNIQSDDLLNDDIVKNVGSIGPNAEFTYSFTVVGLNVGSHDLTVGLESDQIELVSGEKQIEVLKATPPSDAPAVSLASVNLSSASTSSSGTVSLDTVKIESVELNLTKNRTDHHTKDFDYSGLVVRRGQKFQITLNSSKPVGGSMVTARAVFQLQSSKVSKTHAFEVETISKTEGKTIHLEVQPPANVAIGEYELMLAVEKDKRVTIVHRNIKLVILFNPWCSEDHAYYPNVSDLSEYVLNNTGYIWQGSADNYKAKPWQYAQFTKNSLEVALWIVDHVPVGDRGNPIKVSRYASALVNEQEDNGILVGRWEGGFSGGKNPESWSGSAEILAKFNPKKQPVLFGQCWVFAGVLTTVLRCLGLPCRPVTNFESAHDTNFNRAIDVYYKDNGDPVPNQKDESIWNFHVWNDVWMKRPDLPEGFGGWQAVDATPQELSRQGGGIRLGPASVRAVKLGQRLNYDVEFVISEVNADKRYYTVHSDKRKELVQVETDVIGKYISTKAIGSSERHDITDEYKFKEGTTSERAALLYGESESSKVLGMDMTFDRNVQIGEDFKVKVSVTNKSSSTKELKVTINGHVTSYTGANGQLVKSMQKSINLEGKKTTQLEMAVDDAEYLRTLKGGNFFNFVAMAYSTADKLSMVKTKNYRLKTPDVAIKLPSGGLKLYHLATVQASFTNPLKTKLTGGKFVLHGQGYVQDATVDISNVPPKGAASAQLSTIPVKQGKVGLVVTFTSDQLIDITGDVTADVQ